MVDLHCHILPGLDDGAADMEAALKMARIAQEDGIRAICATPHAGVHPYYNSRGEILEATEAFRTEIENSEIQVEIFPGSEVSVTTDITAMADSGELVTLKDSSYILVELPFYGDLSGAKQQIFELSIAGYRVILAHPERAQACQQDPGVVEELRYAGCRAQINAGSIRGTEGRTVRRICHIWLEKDLVDVIASDAHNPTKRRPVLSPSRADVIDIGGEEMWRRLTVENPARILKDEDTQ